MSNVNQTTCKHGAAYNNDYKLDGVTLGPPFPLETVEKVTTFTFDPSDVIVASYPRSGEDFLGEIVWLLMNEADTEGATNIPLSKRLPLMEMAGLDGAAPTVEKMLSHAPPRVVSTHLPYSLLGDALEKGKPKVLVVMRDPKELILSQYRSYRKWPGRHLPCFEYFFETFVRTERTLFGSHFDHLLGYWGHDKDQHMLLMKYSEMRCNVEDSVLLISHFLNKDLTPKQIHAIVKFMSCHQEARSVDDETEAVYVDAVIGVKLFEADIDMDSTVENNKPEEQKDEKKDEEKTEENIRIVARRQEEDAGSESESQMEGPLVPPMEVEIFWAPQKVQLSPDQEEYYDNLTKTRLEPAGLHFT